MKIDLTQFRQTFLQESAEHIATMEAGLLALRTNPEDDQTLNTVFRSAHSIKGGAGSVGLEAVARFTHGMENLLDRLRAREMVVTEEIVALLLVAVDALQTLLAAEPGAELPEEARHLAERIEALAAGAPHIAEPIRIAQVDSREDAPAVWRVVFRPDREMFQSGTNPLVLLRNLAALGDVSVTHLDAADLPPLAELDPEHCYLAWTVEIATSRTEPELREVFEFVEHLAEITMQRLDSPPLSHAPEPSAAAALPASPAVRSVAVPGQDAGRIAKKSGSARATGESSSIRVATEKVDRLIDLVGELVIAHVMTAQMVERFTPDCLPKLRESVATMERNTRELHERVMAVRMLPVGALFQRYVRTVYDIAQATGKQIALATAGEETEIDKSMLELLADPLTHLIRNAADHGIETPEARLAAGKPEEGTIHLRALHRAGRIVIEVEDDGGGIDRARVRAKAVERGLIAPDAAMSDDELRRLIFEPGFSTRDEVSDLSGRGVGMDVVRQNVQRLNGTIALTSETGRGSTVSIELPLTLAILEGLLVRVADRTLVLPLLSVVETVAPRAGQIERVAEKGHVVVIRDESIPLLRLHRFLGLSESPAGSEETRSLVVVVEAGHKKIGLVVDELLGQQQVVVKSLERHQRKVDGLMGATILGDGCVAPIVDVACLAGMDLYALDAGAPPALQLPTEVQPGKRGEPTHAMV